jgi:hypothetical protein
VTLLTNNFEGGSNGSTITTGNSGGASGNAWDTITIGTSAVDVYDNSQAAHGSLSCKLSTAATSVSVYNAWTTSMGTLTQRPAS